jgi:Ca2+-binding RTX toxin-like protein
MQFDRVAAIHVNAGAGNDLLDLRGMRNWKATAARNLESIRSFVVFGGKGADRFYSQSSDPEEAWVGPALRGGDGPDILIGGEGKDYLYGGAGKDRIFGRGGDDWLKGGGNADYLSGGNGDDVLEGGSGDDRMLGGRGDDFLEGKRGTDFMRGGPGRDVMYQNTNSHRWPGGCSKAPPGLCNPIVN